MKRAVRNSWWYKPDNELFQGTPGVPACMGDWKDEHLKIIARALAEALVWKSKADAEGYNWSGVTYFEVVKENVIRNLWDFSPQVPYYIGSLPDSRLDVYLGTEKHTAVYTSGEGINKKYHSSYETETEIHYVYNLQWPRNMEERLENLYDTFVWPKHTIGQILGTLLNIFVYYILGNLAIFEAIGTHYWFPFSHLFLREKHLININLSAPFGSLINIALVIGFYALVFQGLILSAVAPDPPGTQGAALRTRKGLAP